VKVEIFALSDVGLVRELNEDNYKTLPDKNLAVVCDGMGGHAAGEVASQLAVDTIVEVMKSPENFEPIPDSLELDDDFDESGYLLVHAIRLASRRIYLKSSRDSAMKGMGTTVVAAQIKDDSVMVCHVGDSRVYRFRNGNLEQLTVDHSWINELISSNQLTEEESKNFVNKNVITRALGTRENVKVDIRQDRVLDDDIYLLCSDGLCGFVSDSDILRSISNREAGLEGICKDLIKRANAAGGEDNITAALMHVTGVAKSGNAEKELIRQTVEEETSAELTLEDRILRKGFRPAKNQDQPAAEQSVTITKPMQVEEEKKGKKGGLGWYILAVIIALAIIGYVGYSYDIGGMKPRVDGIISSLGIIPEPQASADEPVVQGTVFLGLRDFPDSLYDHTLYVDMIPQGTVSQFMNNQLGLEPGYHILELRNDDGLVYARLNKTFKAGEIILTPTEFKKAE
jgi:serine/threonine protein phosphatase PrpC